MAGVVILSLWARSWAGGDHYAAEIARSRERQARMQGVQFTIPWLRLHYIGDIWYSVQIDNPFGQGHLSGVTSSDGEQEGINWSPGIEFPRRTRQEYIWDGGLAFGCIRGNDTLVSVTGYLGENSAGNEFRSYEPISEISNLPTSPHYDPAAHAEQQFEAVYDDTSALPFNRGSDAIEGRKHKPIGIRVRQKSHAWSQGPAQRIIIVDNWITNISSEPIQQGCVGVFVRPDIRSDQYFATTGQYIGTDDICGWISSIPGPQCQQRETLNVAWVADNDGDPVEWEYNRASTRGVLGIRVLRTPPGGQLGFNWWASDYQKIDWGPRRLRDAQGFFGSLGEPLGDRNRYKMMVNGEIDYDQVLAAIDWSAHGWSAPLRNPKQAEAVARGLDVALLLSYGPLPDILPGDSVPFTFAIVGADEFHKNPRNFQDNLDPHKPRPYLDNLDFTGLINLARQAGRLFDAPGVDTDGDGDPGQFWQVCRRRACGPYAEQCVYVWYRGDGVPDWTTPAAKTPPPPFTLITDVNTIVLRWDGAVTETARDPTTLRSDFEGYRVYTAKTAIGADWSFVSSWDREDFARWVYAPLTNDWRQESYAFPIDEWQEEIGIPGFDPLAYTHPSFLTSYRDSTVDTFFNFDGEIIRVTPRERYSYWAPEGLNQENEYLMGETWETNPIQRVTERDTVIDGDTLTFGVYECRIEHLNPSIPLFVAVTAFDQYDYVQKSGPAESAPQTNAQQAIPLPSAGLVVDSGLKVSVYPNPYKTLFRDASGNRTNYFEQGYEAPGQPRLTDRDRRIWFINLPDSATIRIWTLDGDLVREIDHPDRFLTTYSSICGWDLITRNTQTVESGIYLWRVDSRLGAQVGKLVIIK